ncbi:MAG TPA: hypothetical protein VJT32_11495 [bacterium]|nr:hypothetical protein [bacterium]
MDRRRDAREVRHDAGDLFNDLAAGRERQPERSEPANGPIRAGADGTRRRPSLSPGSGGAFPTPAGHAGPLVRRGHRARGRRDLRQA